jgi:hypothetical protein
MGGGGVIVLLAALALSGCGNHEAVAKREDLQTDQVLPLTLDGFLKGSSDVEQVAGICTPDSTRTSLNCDLYNGLAEWTITELTLRVTWSPFENNDARSYRITTAIKPITTERVTVRLGLKLPDDDVSVVAGKLRANSHWAWQNVGAKGKPAK